MKRTKYERDDEGRIVLRGTVWRIVFSIFFLLSGIGFLWAGWLVWTQYTGPDQKVAIIGWVIGLFILGVAIRLMVKRL